MCIRDRSNAPLIPLHVLHAKPTIPKPNCSSSPKRCAYFKYSSTTLEPGAREVFTHGFRFNPKALAFLARKAAATTFLGLLVLVHEVIACLLYTSPSPRD